MSLDSECWVVNPLAILSSPRGTNPVQLTVGRYDHAMVVPNRQRPQRYKWTVEWHKFEAAGTSLVAPKVSDTELF